MRVKLSLLTDLLAASIVLAAGASVLGQEYRYAIVDVGDIGGNGTDALAINNSGIIVGSSIDSNSGALEAYIWDNGVSHYLDRLPNSGLALALDISDGGDVVGRGMNANNDYRALLWRNGETTPFDLGTLGGSFARADGINSNGHVVGDSGFQGGGANAFRWMDGKMEPLGDFGVQGGFGNAINDREQVVGQAKGTDFSGYRAFLWDNGNLINLGSLLSNRESSANDINESELIVGTAHVLDGTGRAVIWRERSIINIHNDAIAVESFATAVNESSQIVGALVVDDFPLEYGAFLYEENGPMVNLFTLLPPRNKWLRTETAFDVNDHGEIAGRGYRQGSSERHGYLITPVHPTLTLQGPQPGRAGTLNGMRVTGCTPGARVHFYYSTHGGGTLVPGCNHTDGVTLQLENPIRAGSATANANGVATLTRFIPGNARNLGDILIQAIDADDCQISQLVVVQFE